jgi:VWFA-related protein
MAARSSAPLSNGQRIRLGNLSWSSRKEVTMNGPRQATRLRAALLAVVLALLSSVVVGAQDGSQLQITQVDNSAFPNVTVYVSVKDSSGAPAGIDPGLLQVSEGGQPMQIVGVRGGGAADAQSIPVTTMLVVDISGSMLKNGKLDAAKAAARSYVAQMRPGDQAGLIAYDTGVYRVQPISTDVAALTAAIDGLQAGSDTAMYDALIEAERDLQGVTGRRAIIVLTDGLDNQSHVGDGCASRIGEGGLSISAIRFGESTTLGQSGLDESALRSLAENAGGEYAFATDAATLSALYQQYGRALQSEYAITYRSPNTLRDGVNRGLAVSIAAGGPAAAGTYNPGGVLPEVPTRSWTLFGALAFVLLALLIIPLFFMGGGNPLAPRRAGSSGKVRIKLASAPAAGKARGRVKLR